VALLFILCCLLASTAKAAGPPSGQNSALLYAVDESANIRGSISVYDIAADHRLIKTIRTVPRVGDVRGVAASAVTGKLYVAYDDVSSTGMVYCLDIYNDTILWNRPISPGVDRLAISPDGKLLYVPTGEGRSADFINVVDGATGEVVRKVHFSNRSHDTLYPISGPIFQETKANDGSGEYLYLVDPKSYTVSRVGPFSGILGPYAVDSSSNYVVNNVTNLWGMQVANLKTGQIVTASLPDHPLGSPGLLHGIGWSPDQSEVWENSRWNDPHVYVWAMDNPMAPVLKQTLTLQNGQGSHWLTFDIKGNYAYVAPNKNSNAGTEIFNARTHTSLGLIGASEDMIAIEFVDGKISRIGDQFGIGRR
jgi:hypothetical protein